MVRLYRVLAASRALQVVAEAQKERALAALDTKHWCKLLPSADCPAFHDILKVVCGYGAGLR